MTGVQTCALPIYSGEWELGRIEVYGVVVHVDPDQGFELEDAPHGSIGEADFAAGDAVARGGVLLRDFGGDSVGGIEVDSGGRWEGVDGQALIPGAVELLGVHLQYYGAMRILFVSLLAATALLGQVQTTQVQPETDRTVTTTDGQRITGRVLNEGNTDLQLREANGRIRLLRKADGDRFRVVTSQTDWPTYNGSNGGNRYSTLTQINKNNVSKMTMQWMFPLGNVNQVENTPLVVDGVMYVSSANQVWALDAGSGRQIWTYRRNRTQGITGNAAIGFNRGVAQAGDRIFLLTDNAHLIAVSKANGELLWETTMADSKENYNGTSAPLVAGGLVISGTAGGDEGVRGFVAAYDPQTGKEVWRFWTVPKPGQPGAEEVANTWSGANADHRSGATWMTGTYDESTGLIYWPVGNPGPDYDGADRLGDNLYTDCVIALDAKTGKLKWYYQFTPHDVHDWDAQEPPVLIDANWQGQPRKLLIQANRNGFF